MPISTSNFVKGIQQDLQKSIPQLDSYVEAVDMRLITEAGGTTFGLENIKGNSLLTLIPATSDVYEASIDNDPNIFPVNLASYAIVVNGITVNYDPPSFSSYLLFLEAFAAIINANTATLFIKAVVADTEDKLIIWSTTLLSPTTLTITINNTTNNFTLTKIVDGIASPKILGWEVIRDDIYLFTSNSVATSPTATAGQIWKIVYDNQLLTLTSITLLYNNIINLSRGNPIANPGMIEGRYENPSIVKLYWTDNYNPPRNINVADANIFGVSPSNLDIISRVNMSLPILQEVVQSGALLTGVHQIAYRLKNNNGNETIFSPCSNLVHVTAASEQVSDLNLYYGSISQQNSTKSLRYRIGEVDVSFERIEVVDIYYSSNTTVPEINIVYDLPVPSTGIVEFTITGNETPIPITIQEFTSFSTNFTKVGTIATKDNILFFGNVTLGTFDIDFDAHTYRFPRSTATTTITGTNNISSITAANWTTLDEDADAIQDYDSQAPTNSVNNLYQANSTVFGGSGPNISYKFTDPNSSTYPEGVMYLDGTIKTGFSHIPHRSLSKDSTTIDLNIPNQTHPHVYTFRSPASPYLSFLERGYQRDEMYRFGIIFYDLQGTPGFVKWIADIRFPHIYMPTVGTTRTMQFNHCSFTTPNCYGYNLGIEWTIDVSSIADQISGFSIVRVERTQADKHIIGSGQFHLSYYNGLDAIPISLVPDHIDNSSASDNAGGVRMAGVIATINSPNFLFSGFPGFSTGDQVDITGVMNDNGTVNVWDAGALGLDNKLQLVKNYSLDNTGNIPYPIRNSTANSNNPYTIAEANVIENFNVAPSTFQFPVAAPFTCANHSPEAHECAGGKTLVIYFASADNNFEPYDVYPGTPNPDAFQRAAQDGIENTRRAYLCNYKKVVTNQYGGNTFTARSLNKYISTGNYVPVNTSSSINTFTTFGGDTFVTIFDNVKQFRNDSGEVPGVGDIHTIRFFPVETSVNIDLRYTLGTEARVPNKDELADSFDSEDFYYDPVYSVENNIKSFFPKPDPYQPTTVYDVAIYNSQTKINGELKDSWTNFKSTDYKEADSKYGALTSLQTLKNQLIFLQPKATGIAAVNERLLVNTTAGSLSLGTGGVLERLDYADTTSGCQHRFAITKNKEQLFYFDGRDKQIKTFSGETTPVSIVKGLSAYFNQQVTTRMYEDNPYLWKGITATYDNRFKEAIFTFLDLYEENDVSFTVAYNSIVDCFSSFYSFHPVCYINDSYNIITQPDDVLLNKLYIHNNAGFGDFYDETDKRPCSLSLLVNPNQLDKVFDNFQWYSESEDTIGHIREDTWDLIRCRTNRQNTDFQVFADYGKRAENLFNFKIPHDLVANTAVNSNIYTDLSPFYRIKFGKRIRNPWMYVDFSYLNTNDYHFVMNYLNTIYRQSTR